MLIELLTTVYMKGVRKEQYFEIRKYEEDQKEMKILK